MDEPPNKLVILVIGVILIGLIFGLLFEDIEMLSPKEEKKYYIVQKPVCTTIVTTNQECSLVDYFEDYNQWVCETRPYQIDIPPITLYHQESNNPAGCFTRFSTTVTNTEIFDVKMTMDINILDNLQRYVETVSQTKTVNALSTGFFSIEYRYNCGKSRIVNYIPQFHIPERRFCEWQVKTKTKQNYICNDFNVYSEICE